MARYRELYCASCFPVFQNRMYDSKSEAINCPKGEIRLVEDLESGLIYNADFQPGLLDYDEHYQNEQGLSSAFRQHLEDVAQIVTQAMGEDGLVEVGCGKGLFLEFLLQSGVDVMGFDPTYEGSNPKIHRKYFDTEAEVNAKGLILRHVLEHIKDPYAFLLSLKEANGGQGLIYIEVPDFDWICARKAWFDVFYEHVNYFRKGDFYRLFDEVIDVKNVFGGQYLYVLADLKYLKEPKYKVAEKVDFPVGFDHAASTAQHSTAQNVVWGGASKGVIFSLLMQRKGVVFDAVIDLNPAKQGKYLPATGLLVESPKEVLPKLSGEATIWVMNSNYLDEIKEMSSGIFHYKCIDHEFI